MTASGMAAQNPGAPMRTHAPSMNLASAADSQTACHLLDKVAAEIRVMIYERVFGTSEYARFSSTLTDKSVPATNADSTGEATPARINTSILATSKQIREEALDAFYNNKIVRLDFAQLRNLLDSRASGQLDLLDMVQNIQIVDCNQAEPEDSIHSILKEARALPRIKSLSILSDCLTGPDRRHVTVREEAQRLGLGSVTCYDIGRYRISDQPEHVQFVNAKLVKMWPSAASMLDDYDALDCDQSQRIHPEPGGMGLTYVFSSVGGLAPLHEIITTPGTEEEDHSPDDFNSPAHNEWMNRVTDRSGFLRSTVSDPPRVRHVSDSPDQDVPLHKLGPQHDPARLEQASEMLAMNIGRYNRATHDEDDWPIEEEAKPSWVELGDPNLLDVQEKAQRESRAAWREYKLVDWPTDPTRACKLSGVREELLECHIFSQVFGRETIARAGRRQLLQLWYLSVAVYVKFGEHQGDQANGLEEADGDEGSRSQEDDREMDEGLENEEGHEQTTDTPEELPGGEPNGMVEDDETAMHEWSAELMRKYLRLVKGIEESDLLKASETTMRKTFIIGLSYAYQLLEPPSTEEPNLEATGSGSSHAQSPTEDLENPSVEAANERQSRDEAGANLITQEPGSIDEDIYQPFLYSYADALADMFKSALTGRYDHLDLGGAA